METSNGIKEIKIYNKENIFEDSYSLNTEMLSEFLKNTMLFKNTKTFFEVIAIFTVSLVIFVFLKIILVVI